MTGNWSSCVVTNTYMQCISWVTDVVMEDELTVCCCSSPYHQQEQSIKATPFSGWHLYIICWLMQPPPVWEGGVGFVSKGMVEAHCPPPAEDIQVTLLRETIELCLVSSPLSILMFSESRVRAVPLNVLSAPKDAFDWSSFIGIVSGCHLMSWHPGLSQGEGLVNHVA